MVIFHSYLSHQQSSAGKVIVDDRESLTMPLRMGGWETHQYLGISWSISDFPLRKVSGVLLATERLIIQGSNGWDELLSSSTRIYFSRFDISHLPPGKLTYPWKITISIGKSHINGPFSIAMLVITIRFHQTWLAGKSPVTEWRFRSLGASPISFYGPWLPPSAMFDDPQYYSLLTTKNPTMIPWRAR